jgi:molybdate/tungstate transport system substrate-binding protein
MSRRGALAVCCAAALAPGVAGCAAGGTAHREAGARAKHGARSHGTVAVLYAASLVRMMEDDLGPAFAHATGYGYEGFPGGSSELAAEIKGRVRQADVFISASPEADRALAGAANGDYVTWYLTFASAPLVLGYNPHSSFAAQFRAKPWYRVITEAGIRVGRTDPKLDPKGRLTVSAIDEAAARLREPGLASALPRFEMFPEQSLVGRLQAGQLDAGFFYSNEAHEAGMPTVPLTPVTAGATFTATIPRGAGNGRGAQAFVAFLLRPAGRALLARSGLTVLAPALSGARAAVPAPVRALAGSR